MSSRLLYMLKFVVVLWFFIASLQTLYFFFRFLTRDVHILFLGETERNRVSYSDVYSFTERLKEKYSEQDILSLRTADGRVFFVTRYVLFPTYVYWDSEKRAPSDAIKVEYK